MLLKFMNLYSNKEEYIHKLPNPNIPNTELWNNQKMSVKDILFQTLGIKGKSKLARP